MGRHVARRQFQPSVFTTGYVGSEQDYGFAFPLSFLLSAATASDKDEEESSTFAFVKKYWWAGPAVLALAYVGINKGLDHVAARRKESK
jgi:hypothetical protein